MQLLYMGFEQKQNIRQFVFHKMAHGEETKVFEVSIDLALLLRNHVSLQEGPALCLCVLRAELESAGAPQLPPSRRALTDQHVQAYLVARSVPKPKRPGLKASLHRT